MQDVQQLYEELYAYVADLWVVDTHEHKANYKANKHLDYLTITLNTYARLDLRSAGMSLEALNQARDVSLPLMERWRLCEPYWQACRNTSYIRTHERIAREQYGVEGVNSRTIGQLSEMFSRRDHARSYGESLERAHILCCITDSDPGCDRRHERFAFRLEEFVERIDMPAVTQALGSPIRSFAAWLEACGETIRRYVAQGAVAFKTTIATDRTLAIGPGSYVAAEESFLQALNAPAPFEPCPDYQDFMFRFVLDQLRLYDLPVQMHTGMAASNNNIITNGNPMLLSPLFADYPDLDFVMMHMGYPYYLELSALAKMFPNVYPDLSWAHMISPFAARLALSEWLDAVPGTKIFAFGGDCGHEDAILAHLHLARENVCRVLAHKVAEGSFDMDCARWLATRMFRDNPYQVFRLDRAGVPLR